MKHGVRKHGLRSSGAKLLGPIVTLSWATVSVEGGSVEIVAAQNVTAIESGTATKSGAAPSAASRALPSEPKVLEALVLDLDRRMFEAYNAHDIEKLMSFFAPDLEFIHDKDGVVGFEQVKSGLTQVFEANPDIRRELVADSVKVYPIREYGAIQTGEHRFCHTEQGRQDCGTFQFMQIWRYRDGEWKVAREVSYGH